MKNKKNLIISIVIILLVILAAILIILGLTHNPIITPTKKEEPPKEAKKELVNGHMTNVEQSLTKQVVYENYRFKSLFISEQGPYYVIDFIVDNISSENQEHTHLTFTFLDSNKKVIVEEQIEIPTLVAGQSTTIQHLGASKKIYDAFSYKVSPAKKATLPQN